MSLPDVTLQRYEPSCCRRPRLRRRCLRRRIFRMKRQSHDCHLFCYLTDARYSFLFNHSGSIQLFQTSSSVGITIVDVTNAVHRSGSATDAIPSGRSQTRSPTKPTWWLHRMIASHSTFTVVYATCGGGRMKEAIRRLSIIGFVRERANSIASLSTTWPTSCIANSSANLALRIIG